MILQLISNARAFVEGRKTYIVTFVAALLNLLVAFNVISVEQLEQVNMVLAALGLAALRAGVNKV